MTVKVLVAYATKNGSTAEIARTITEVLREEGLEAELRPVADVGELQEYDAVVLGSPLYKGQWHKDARRFAKRRREELAQRPVWLFSSGPLDASASERNIPPVPSVRRLLIEIHAKEHATFGGCLTEDARSWAARMIVKAGHGGDFRDVKQISAWAQHVGVTLRGGAAPRREER
ncbi:flavodoxin domain-containing protein [Streptomyces kanamyceticus]|uniref:Flavodoxin n=1 Tax=Streptomyces kanamyceticus TaxID=1967 RepID=A0A5J6G864_STRKN|nr:flavodoxin domain-containing protein [Streptomyces kanamyceticus]QEU90118.1 flavodoxin [Streptomyces kanamyceticus]